MKVFISASAASLTVEGLQHKLESLFPNGVVKAREGSGLGKYIAVTVSVVTADQCASKILDNSPSLTKIMIHLSNSRGVVEENKAVKTSLVSRGFEQKRAGIKWRDFTAAPDVALWKIGQWFTTNAEALKALHNKDDAE